MEKRIKKLRRSLDMTQQEFADRIGVKRNTIANYETGRNEPIDSVISLICREFHVNEEWLRHGLGEMMAPMTSGALETLAAERGLTHRDYIVIEKFLNLRPEVRAGMVDYFIEISEALRSDDVDPDTPAFAGASIVEREAASDLHAELDRQLGIEKEAMEESEAL